MSSASFWLVLAGALIASEMLSGTFYLLMLGMGALAGAACARLDAPLSLQITVASLIGLAACFAVWQVRGRKVTHAGGDDAANPLGQLDVGVTVTVAAWNADGTCEVKHRGASWSAVGRPGLSDRVAGPHRIVSIEGSRLVIEPL